MSGPAGVAEDVRARIYRDLADAGATLPLRVLRPLGDAIARALGFAFLTVFRTPPGRVFFRGPYARFAAWFWPRVMRMRHSDDPVQVAAGYLRYGSVLGALDVRVGDASPGERVELIFPYCPVGLHHRHGAVCDDSVCTDTAIVDALGGALEIPDTIAHGASACTFVITRPGAAAPPAD